MYYLLSTQQVLYATLPHGLGQYNNLIQDDEEY